MRTCMHLPGIDVFLETEKQPSFIGDLSIKTQTLSLAVCALCVCVRVCVCRCRARGAVHLLCVAELCNSTLTLSARH